MAQIIRLRPAMGALRIVLSARRALLAATLPGGNVSSAECVAAIRSLVLRAPVSGGPEAAVEMIRQARGLLAGPFQRSAEWEVEQLRAIFTGASADAAVFVEDGASKATLPAAKPAPKAALGRWNPFSSFGRADS